MTLVPEFSTTAQTYFDSDVQAVDYENPKNAAKIINDFVEEKTNNKIHDLVDGRQLSISILICTLNLAINFLLVLNYFGYTYCIVTFYDL